MQIVIEPVKDSEVQLLTDLSKKTFYDTFNEQNTKEDMEIFLKATFNTERIHAEMQDKSNRFFLARNNNDILGYIKLSTETPDMPSEAVDALEISRLYVVKDKIGTGAGRALMQFAITFAEENNKDVLYLGVWEHNKRAIDFYLKFGFEKFDEHVFMLGNDAQTDWLMKKKLN